MNCSNPRNQQRKRVRASGMASLLLCTAGGFVSLYSHPVFAFSLASTTIRSPLSQQRFEPSPRLALQERQRSTLSFGQLSSALVSSLSSDDELLTKISGKRRAKLASNMFTARGRRLTQEEEKKFLSQVVELRRIKAVESQTREHLTTSFATEGEPILEYAKAAGYGTEVRSYKLAILNGHKAREELVTGNMGLVHFCVSEIIGKKKTTSNSTPTGSYVGGRKLNSLGRDDLVQEGVIGLTRAIDRWNPAIGGKFSTYAVYWIRAAILRCIAERDDLMRVPEYVTQSVRKVTKAARSLGIELHENDYDSESLEKQDSWVEADLKIKALAAESGLTEKQVQQAIEVHSRRSRGGYVAFEEAWMLNPGKNGNFEGDIVTSASLQETSRGSADLEHLRNTFSRFLRPKEMEALFWRYGLLNEKNAASASSIQVDKPINYVAEAEAELFGSPDGDVKKKKRPAMKAARGSIPTKGKWGEAMSFNEVGIHMQVSAEYGRRLCHAALNKLREAADDGRLEPALLF